MYNDKSFLRTDFHQNLCDASQTLELRIYLKFLGLRIKSILASFRERQFLPTSKSRVSDERLNLMANDRDNGG